MESYQIVPDQPQENQEHFNKMVEAGEGAVSRGNNKFDANGNIIKPSSSVDGEKQQEVNKEQNRTDEVPEKFRNKDGNVDIESLIKSYKELEKKIGSKEPNQENNTEIKDNKQENKDSLKIENVEDAVKIATEKGIDFRSLENEFASTGNLSEDTFKMLNDKGIPREMVEQFIAGQQARTVAIRNEILQSVGGEEKYTEIVNWAKNNLSDNEIASYNKAMNTNDKGIIDLAVNGLKAKFIDANGQAPKLVTGKSPSSGNTSSLQPFKSMQQYIEAMKDPRYQKDGVYRDEVYKRLNVSNL